MKTEIIELLIKEGKVSGETNHENINNFYNLVKEIGLEETDNIKASEISKDLNTDYIGKNLYVYEEVGSTNTLAKFLSQNGDENGTVVISEKQTASRGRSGKSWQSPLGGIWLSIIFAPKVNESKIHLITLATGVAVANALEKTGIENPKIKWPNDIIINGKKVCGILTETSSQANKTENVIIGVGIDANVDVEDFPKDLQHKTTTLKKELGREINENLLIQTFLEEFEKIGELFNQERFEEILNEWRKRSYSIGKNVEVRMPLHENYEGYVVGIDKEGALIIEKIDGTLEKVISGECVIKN